MTDAHRGTGGWEPIPSGDHDPEAGADATAFVQLPEGVFDRLPGSPLAAPGHGYVPPHIAAGPADAWAPQGSGTPPHAPEWPTPAQGTETAHTTGTAHAPAGAAAPRPRTGGYDTGDTAQWTFPDALPTRSEPATPGQDPAPSTTGQWSIPLAESELPEESGEFTTSVLASQWSAAPPATLPGGASAPWATAPAPDWHGTPADATPVHGTPVHEATPAHGTDTAPAHRPPAAPEPPAPQPAAVEEPPPAEPAAPEPPAAADPAPEPPADRPEPEAEPAADAEPPAQAPADDPVADAPEEPTAEAPEDLPAEEPAAEEPEGAPAPGARHDEHPLISYVLRVNGVDRPVTEAWIGESLLYVLRERLGLAGAKDGCSQGECGACNIQVDGRLVASCLVPAATTAGSEIRTVEGLAADGHPSDVQRALARCGAVQCGFCVPGMAMTVHDLLEGNPAPSDQEARQALCGNLCRCSGYRGVLEAVQEVVAERRAHAAASEPEPPGEPRIPHQAGPGAGGVHPTAHEPYGQDGGAA
ncbi:2Fe-2S iron-sulfur cluster-binding protein [Streptomyces sp. NPDC002454]